MSPGPATQQHPESTNDHSNQHAVDYETQIYTRGLDFERPPLTFQTSNWEELACNRLSVDAKGYVFGSAGVRETSDKNRIAFKKWNIVPNRLAEYKGLPSLKTQILGEQLQYPIAMAPVGVLKIFDPDREIAATRAAAKESVP
jgi:lactate 2-monooxygenase